MNKLEDAYGVTLKVGQVVVTPKCGMTRITKNGESDLYALPRVGMVTKVTKTRVTVECYMRGDKKLYKSKVVFSPEGVVVIDELPASVAFMRHRYATV